MNDKSNFYVFEKKEILLVVVFVILVAVTSFFFGLKIGSNYAFEKAGCADEAEKVLDTPVSKSDKVDLTSPEEEKVQELVQEQSSNNVSKEDLNKRIEESLKEKMVKEFSNENREFNDLDAGTQQPEQRVEQREEEPAAQVQEAVNQVEQSNASDDEYTGKYTIVVGSFESIDDAKEFAEGFRVLGFSPIINEKDIPGKGNRFRVSLGAFERMIEATQYIKKNRSLFAGRDKFITKFD